MPTTDPGAEPSPLAPEGEFDYLLAGWQEPTPTRQLTEEESRADDEAMAELFGPGYVPSASPTPVITGTIPGRAYDLIRRGVPMAELKAAGSKAVFNALLKTAMIWQQADPPGQKWEWYRRLLSTEWRLGQQARLHRGREMDDEQVGALLDKVWAKAEEVIANSPAFTRVGLDALVQRLREEVAAADWTATEEPDDKIVYQFALAEAERRGHSHPVLTVAAVSRATGISHGSCDRSLKRLVKAGLLQVHTPGKRTPKRKVGDSGVGSEVGSGQGTIYTIVALTRSPKGSA